MTKKEKPMPEGEFIGIWIFVNMLLIALVFGYFHIPVTIPNIIGWFVVSWIATLSYFSTNK